MSLRYRFLRKIDEIRGKKTSECWNWIGFVDRWGNGRIRGDEKGKDGKGKKILAHRASYMVFKGEIPEGKLVIHSCDNPKCVNPSHLRIGTHQENMNDVKKRNRHNNGKKTVCPRCGNDFVTKKNGRRYCVHCAKEIARFKYNGIPYPY